jgi:DNA recombination protein RmuC
MEVLYIIASAALSAIIVWVIMLQQRKIMVQEAQNEASIIKAGLESRDEEFQKQQLEYEEKIKSTFTILARDALDEVVAKADAQKEKSFSSATEELSKSMKTYMENANRIERENIQRGTKLESEIGKVSQLGIELSKDTKDLTRALKADAQAQGAWGELVLENLLQSLGFVEGTDYSRQFSETLPDGTRPRADFIINLPGERHVIIDSKVSLKAWELYVNAEDDVSADSAMAEHCKSIKKHVKDLASKNYHLLPSVNSVDFVLMFVPLESAFGAAMRNNPDLYIDITGNVRVKVVTGATIVTTLMLIQEIWKRENQSANQLKLMEETGKLHDKIVGFMDSFEVVGFEIKQAAEAFDEARNRLVDGTGNVLKRTQNLKILGAKVKKELPAALIEEGNYNHESAADEIIDTEQE